MFYILCVLQISELSGLFLWSNFENTGVTFSGGRFYVEYCKVIKRTKV